MSDRPPQDSSVLPFHCIPSEQRDVHYIRRPGRPRKVHPPRTVFDYALVNDERRQAFIAKQIEQYEAEADVVERLWRLMSQIAEEAAALKFSKRQMELEDRVETEKISSAITEAYVRIAKLVLEIAKLGGFNRVDPNNPKVQTLVKFFHGQLAEAARDTLDDATFDAFFKNYQARLEGWEDRK